MTVDTRSDDRDADHPEPGDDEPSPGRPGARDHETTNPGDQGPASRRPARHDEPATGSAPHHEPRLPKPTAARPEPSHAAPGGHGGQRPGRPVLARATEPCPPTAARRTEPAPAPAAHPQPRTSRSAPRGEATCAGPVAPSPKAAPTLPHPRTRRAEGRGTRREPETRRVLYVPVRRGPLGCVTRLFRTPLGARTAVAFTTEELLIAALGPGQAWIRLAESALRAQTAPLGVTRLTLDPQLVRPATRHSPAGRPAPERRSTATRSPTPRPAASPAAVAAAPYAPAGETRLAAR